MESANSALASSAEPFAVAIKIYQLNAKAIAMQSSQTAIIWSVSPASITLNHAAKY